MSEIVRIDDDARSARPIMDVVFVHGLDGDKRLTWTSGGKDEGFWPRWIADDNVSCGVWSVGYDAWSSRWRGSAMTLQERGVNLLAQLDAAGIGERGVCFVAHSLGGLVVKQMLFNAHLMPSLYGRMLTATRGAVFLATPHDGSRLAGFVERFSRAYRPTPAVRDLQENSAYLALLGDWYRDNVGELGIQNLIMYETRKTHGLLVVDAGSANPGLVNTRRIPVDANHTEICKPQSRASLVYTQVSRVVEELLVREGAMRTADPGRADGRTELRAWAVAEYPRELRSRESTDEATIEFVNQSATTLEISWASFSGRLEPWMLLQPGEAREISTFTGHPWLIGDRDGNRFLVVESDTGPGRAVVSSAQLRQ